MTRALVFGLVACAYVTLAVIKTIPLSRHFTTHLPSDLGDPLLTTWIMAWGTHALAHHPFSLFDANIVYPLDRTLAFSDHLLGVLPLFAPVYSATGNPIAAANTVFLLSFALSALAAFCLVYMLTSAPWPSFLAGLLFGFAPISLRATQPRAASQLLLVSTRPLVVAHLSANAQESRARVLRIVLLPANSVLRLPGIHDQRRGRRRGRGLRGGGGPQCVTLGHGASRARLRGRHDGRARSHPPALSRRPSRLGRHLDSPGDGGNVGRPPQLCECTAAFDRCLRVTPSLLRSPGRARAQAVPGIGAAGVGAGRRHGNRQKRRRSHGPRGENHLRCSLRRGHHPLTGPLPRHPRYLRGSRCHISRSTMRFPGGPACACRPDSRSWPCWLPLRWPPSERSGLGNVSPGQDASNAGEPGFPRSCPSRWPRCSSVSWE